MNAKNIIYSALVLDQKSSNILKTYLKTYVPFKYENIFCHHVTIFYGKHFDIPENLGKEFIIQPNFLYANANAACITLSKVPFWTKENPHITLGCKSNVKPSYSNDLIKITNPLENVHHLGNLSGKIGVFTNAGWIY